MTKEQPDLFPRPETPEDLKARLESEGHKVKKVITGKERYQEKKAAKDALAAGRRKLLGETRDGQKELFRE